MRSRPKLTIEQSDEMVRRLFAAMTVRFHAEYGQGFYEHAGKRYVYLSRTRPENVPYDLYDAIEYAREEIIGTELHDKFKWPSVHCFRMTVPWNYKKDPIDFPDAISFLRRQVKAITDVASQLNDQSIKKSLHFHMTDMLGTLDYFSKLGKQFAENPSRLPPKSQWLSMLQPG